MRPALVRRSGFLFCHWNAESENQIYKKLGALGADKLLLTTAQEMIV